MQPLRYFYVTAKARISKTFIIFAEDELSAINEVRSANYQDFEHGLAHAGIEVKYELEDVTLFEGEEDDNG